MTEPISPAKTPLKPANKSNDPKKDGFIAKMIQKGKIYGKMPEKKKNDDKENDKEPKIRRKSRTSFISLFNIATEQDTSQSVKRRTCKFCLRTTKLKSPYNFNHHVRSFCPKLRFFFTENGFGQQFCSFCSSYLQKIQSDKTCIFDS